MTESTSPERPVQLTQLETNNMNALAVLAAGLAHQLNSPLGAISVALDSAEDRLESPEVVRKYLVLARQANARAAAIIQRLAAYAVVCTQPGPAAPLHELIEEALEQFQSSQEADGLEVIREWGPCQPVLTQRYEFSEMLTQLLKNSSQATQGQAHRRVTVRTSQHGGQAVLEIEDTGNGISDEVRSRIFEPFFTTRGVGQGCGLGLALVYQFVRNQGGELGFRSEVGRGTVFRLALPLCQAAA